MTAMGIGLTVAIYITMQALVTGLDATFVETGQPNHLIVIREGSLNEVNSYFNRDLLNTIKLLPGIRKDESGEPRAAGELLVVINHPRLTGESSNVVVRGTTAMGVQLRPEMKLVAGQWFRRGLREVVVSQSLSRRFQNMRLGESSPHVAQRLESGRSVQCRRDCIRFGDHDRCRRRRPGLGPADLHVDAAGGLGCTRRQGHHPTSQRRSPHSPAGHFSERILQKPGCLVGRDQGAGCLHRCDHGCGLLLCCDEYDVRDRPFTDQGSRHSAGTRVFTLEHPLLLHARIDATGTARRAGGCVLALPLHGISTGTANFTNFSEVLFNFRITPKILLHGMLFAAFVGILGGALPARRASRVTLMEALRM